MVRLLLVAVLLVPMAANATCVSDATSQKLSGASRDEFLARCRMNVEKSCNFEAIGNNGKPLTGAAKTNFINKCIRHDVGD